MFWTCYFSVFLVGRGRVCACALATKAATTLHTKHQTLFIFDQGPLCCAPLGVFPAIRATLISDTFDFNSHRSAWVLFILEHFFNMQEFSTSACFKPR